MAVEEKWTKPQDAFQQLLKKTCTVESVKIQECPVADSFL